MMPFLHFLHAVTFISLLLVMVIVLLRYAHVIEKHQNCVLNTASLCTGWICGAGLIMVGNFQVRSSSFFNNKTQRGRCKCR